MERASVAQEVSRSTIRQWRLEVRDVDPDALDTRGPSWNALRSEATFAFDVEPHIQHMEIWFFDNEWSLHPVSVVPLFRHSLLASQQLFAAHVAGKQIRPGVYYGVHAEGENVDTEQFHWLVDPRALYLTQGKWLRSKGRKRAPTKLDFLPPKSVLIDRQIARLDPQSIEMYGDDCPIFKKFTSEAAEILSEETKPCDAGERGSLKVWELHVKDTADFPLSDSEVTQYGLWRGTYRFLSTPPFLRYLKEFGINAISLMPITPCFDEWEYYPWTRNYWGYNPTSFFAVNSDLFFSREPHGCLIELMVTNLRLRNHGVDVVLDAVLNHTCERGDFGPTVHFRILQPSLYLRGSNGEHIDRTNTQHTCALGSTLLKEVEDTMLDFYHASGLRLDTGAALFQKYNHHRRIHEFDSSGVLTSAAFKRSDSLRIWEPAAFPYEYPHGKFPPSDLEWVFPDWVRSFLAGKTQLDFDSNSLVARVAYRLSGNCDYFPYGKNRSLRFASSHDGYNAYDWAAWMFACRAAESDGIQAATLDWDTSHRVLAPYLEAVEELLEDDADVHSQGVFQTISRCFKLSLESLRQSFEQLFWGQVRALQSMVVLSPGAIMFGRGDIEGWSQGGSDNTHNHRKFVKYARSENQHLLRQYMKRLLKLRHELSIFDTTLQYQHSHVSWYAADGDAIESASRLMQFAHDRAAVWRSQSHFVGALFNVGAITNSLAPHLFVAYLGGFHPGFSFRLPSLSVCESHRRPEGVASWRRRLDSYLGVVSFAGEDFSGLSSELLLDQPTFSPGDWYLSDTPRVVVFEAI